MCSLSWGTRCLGSGFSPQRERGASAPGRGGLLPRDHDARGDREYLRLPVLPGDGRHARLQHHRLVVTRTQGGRPGAHGVGPSLGLDSPLSGPSLHGFGSLVPDTHSRAMAGMAETLLGWNARDLFPRIRGALALGARFLLDLPID